MKRTLVTVVLLTIVFALAAYAPPHPKYNGKVKLPKSHSSEIFGKHTQQRVTHVPDSVLVLMVQFSDLSFVGNPQYPDSLVHDRAFFDRYMLHLADYYTDASHGNYQLQYSMYDPFITLSQPMGYYGVDDTTLAVTRQAEFARDIVEAIDQQVNFTQYDAIVVFHAGAGQESDIERIRTSQLWSTFISRIDLQYGFDPENDNYPGIPTNDGKYISEMVVVPEWEWQDYFPTDNSGYVFNTFGVLANQFGHLIGMPNLYDNDWSNGSSEGVGNFCIMGTGAWNANGYVPALPSAYCRMIMGWEQPQLIDSDTTQISLDYLLSHNVGTTKVVKLPISDQEYFLIENRNENPDNSVLNGQASFTFTLLEEGQAYYPQTDPPSDPVPMFEFMHNRFKGCEWDFFLPGYGGPLAPEDGSGLLIWHIDENVITANFRPEEGIDRVNADASHRGVDLEEASGIQDLDATIVANPNFRGGANDTYRSGNNTYFGQSSYNGFLSQPTAESYYGGIPLAVSNISTAGMTMTFDVKFRWILDGGYVGENPVPASFLDLDGDYEEELFYPMPNGKLVVWKDDIPDTLATQKQISKLYAFDEESRKIYIPFDLNSNQDVALYSFTYDTAFHYTSIFARANRTWAAGPILKDSNTILFPLNRTDADSSEIVIQKTTLSQDLETLSLPGKISTNILYAGQDIFSIGKRSGQYVLNRTSYISHETSEFQLPIPADSLVTSIALVPLHEPRADSVLTDDSQRSASKGIELYDLVISAGQGLYVCNINGELQQGYPVVIPFPNPALPSFADIDHNGYLEILIGGENTFAVYGYDGSLLNYPLSSVTNPDTLHISGGIWATDLDQDGKMEILGNMSKNRLYAWNVEGYPPYHAQSGYPVSMQERSLSYPLVGKDASGIPYIYSASNSGKVFRQQIEGLDISQVRNGWFCEYGNLQRNAVYTNFYKPNLYKTRKIFVPGEVYIYPNPWKQIFSPEITFRIMTSERAKVDVRVFDIAGKLLLEEEVTCEAYLPNQRKIQLPVKKMSSGIYIAEIYSNGERKSLKFAIEK